MDAIFSNDNLSHVIQLAVAPVFLLASISGALNVLSLRMGRIIDRGRSLNELSPDQSLYTEEAIDKEQRLLAKRSRLIHSAIALSTVSALFVCMVIVALFVDALFVIGLLWFTAFLFTVALLMLIAGLLCFLREIDMSVHAFHFGAYSMADKN